MEDSNYIYPTTKSIIYWVGFLFVMGLIYYSITPIKEQILSGIEEPGGLEQTRIYLLVFNLLAFLFFSSFAIWSIKSAIKILKQKRVPPKGAYVFYKTKIRTGKTIYYFVIYKFSIASIMLGFCLLFVYLWWQSYGL